MAVLLAGPLEVNILRQNIIDSTDKRKLYNYAYGRHCSATALEMRHVTGPLTAPKMFFACVEMLLFIPTVALDKCGRVFFKRQNILPKEQAIRPGRGLHV
jgi:hypothetical protein